MIKRDKIAGALYGVALGDAMGRLTEFSSTRKIYDRHGRYGPMQLPFPALFTDDTQMTLAVSRALDTARSLTPRELVRTLRREFITWNRKDPRRAPGATCVQAIGIMERYRDVPWTRASQVHSKGCGANMRVAPTAFIADLGTALGAAQLQAAMTHGHPIALAATELTALAIRWAAEGTPLHGLVERLTDSAHSSLTANTYRDEWLGKLHLRWNAAPDTTMRIAWQTCINILTKTQMLLDRANAPLDACEVLGGGWIAEEALALGLYYVIHYEGDLPLTVSYAARTSGDSDSIASIAGAIGGARMGERAWPESWRQRIERRWDIEDAIDVAEVAAR